MSIFKKNSSIWPECPPSSSYHHKINTDAAFKNTDTTRLPQIKSLEIKTLKYNPGFFFLTIRTIFDVLLTQSFDCCGPQKVSVVHLSVKQSPFRKITVIMGYGCSKIHICVHMPESTAAPLRPQPCN